MEEIINYLNTIRRDFSGKPLDEKGVLKNPMEQFAIWMEEAINARVLDPNAMVLSTVDERNRPVSRVVLLRGATPTSFILYTNYNSHKGIQLQKNGFAALNFFWVELDRQIRIEGKVKKTSKEQSDSYFASRPKESQISALASEQSSKIASRETLEERYKVLLDKFKEGSVQRPEWWGGFEVIIDKIEFWQGRPNRLHDRVVYELIDNQWQIHRLAP
jgi:pyridoxamine 5'-phosphate oxidase